jgi:hypothetical protein
MQETPWINSGGEMVYETMKGIWEVRLCEKAGESSIRLLEEQNTKGKKEIQGMQAGRVCNLTQANADVAIMRRLTY